MAHVFSAYGIGRRFDMESSTSDAGEKDSKSKPELPVPEDKSSEKAPIETATADSKKETSLPSNKEKAPKATSAASPSPSPGDVKEGSSNKSEDMKFDAERDKAARKLGCRMFDGALNSSVAHQLFSKIEHEKER